MSWWTATCACCEEVEDMSDSVLITLLICATVLALSLIPRQK